MNAAMSTAVLMFGTMMRTITENQLAPMLRAASASVLTTITDTQASTALQQQGSSEITNGYMRLNALPVTRYQTHAITGAMPTTITIAGMVSGNRHRNSTRRDARGTRSCTHTIVGSSSTSINTTVSAASSTDTRIAASSRGSL